MEAWEEAPTQMTSATCDKSLHSEQKPVFLCSVAALHLWVNEAGTRDPFTMLKLQNLGTRFGAHYSLSFV